MSRSGGVALPDVQEWFEYPPGCPEDTSGCPGVAGRPSRKSGSGGVALPDVRKWSGGPPGCPGIVGWPSRMSGSGWEAL